MFFNNSFDQKKFRPLILAGAVLAATCAPALGITLFGGMLKIGEAERLAASSNEAAP